MQARRHPPHGRPPSADARRPPLHCNLADPRPSTDILRCALMARMSGSSPSDRPLSSANPCSSLRRPHGQHIDPLGESAEHRALIDEDEPVEAFGQIALQTIVQLAIAIPAAIACPLKRAGTCQRQLQRQAHHAKACSTPYHWRPPAKYNHQACCGSSPPPRHLEFKR